MLKAITAQRNRVALCAVLLTVCATITAGYRTFVSLANYDDEGYMLWTIKSFMDGRALYDQVATVYGPLYYFYEWCALSLGGLAPTSDSLRMVSICFWVGAALVAFILAHRATGSLLMAMCVHLLVFRAMSFLGEEPVHPQEACILLLLALGRAFYISNPTLKMIMMGALAGAIATCKINLGVFVVVALAVGLTSAYSLSRGRRAAHLCFCIGALALPAVLMWDRRMTSWVILYGVLVVLSSASVLLTVSNIRWKDGLQFRQGALLVGSFLASIVAICAFPIVKGSTPYNLFEWLIVIPRRAYSISWSLPANIHPIAIAWAAAALVSAILVMQRRISNRWLAMLKVAFGLAILVMCAAGRYGGLLNFATPFVWLVAAPPIYGNSGARDTLTRCLLAVLCVIQTLYAYPVAGSQVGFVSVFMIVMAGLCFWDGAWWLMARPADPAALFSKRLRLAAVLAIIGINVAYAADAMRTYWSFHALDFPGARLVRVEPEKAAALRAIVSRINSSCGTLITEPGLFSFHLWTGKPSPTGVNHQVWMSMLDDAAQNKIVGELGGDPRACVVYQQNVADLWTRSTDVSSKPAVRFIRENFQPVLEGSGYQLLMRSPAGQAAHQIASPPLSTSAQTAAHRLTPSGGRLYE